MNNDNEALAKLRDYISSGKTYFEATGLLKNNGYSQSQIDDATYAYRNGKVTINTNTELTNSILNVEKIKATSHEQSLKNEGQLISPLGNSVYMRINGYISSWWYFLPFFLSIGVLIYLLSK